MNFWNYLGLAALWKKLFGRKSRAYLNKCSHELYEDIYDKNEELREELHDQEDELYEDDDEYFDEQEY